MLCVKTSALFVDGPALCWAGGTMDGGRGRPGPAQAPPRAGPAPPCPEGARACGLLRRPRASPSPGTLRAAASRGCRNKRTVSASARRFHFAGRVEQCSCFLRIMGPLQACAPCIGKGANCVINGLAIHHHPNSS